MQERHEAEAERAGGTGDRDREVAEPVFTSAEDLEGAPAGVEVVKFRTSFANKADVIETVSLAREGSDW